MTESAHRSHGSSFSQRILRPLKAIPSGARFVGQRLIAVPLAILRFLAFGGRREEYPTKGKNTASRGNDPDDISVVANLLKEGVTVAKLNRDIPVSDVLRSVLLEDGDTTLHAYVQELVDGIQRLVNTSSATSIREDPQMRDRAAALRVLLQIMEKTGKLPTEIFLRNIECSDRRTYGIGKGVDVFCGSLDGKKVALKHIRVFRMVVPSQRLDLEKTFLREAVSWYNLSHEHILPFLGLVDVPELGGLCMVSPWVENGDVRQFIDECVEKHGLSGQDFADTVNRLLYEISLGLAYLHSTGIVHGEVRGAHIYINNQREAQLADYGLTSITEVGNEYSASLQGGSGAWLAPELIEPERIHLQSSKATEATDVYSFGCLCVELYTRQSPFPGQTDFKIASRVLRGERPERPVTRGQEMSDSLWSLASWCWREAPADRPSSPRIVEELDQIVIEN